MPHNAMPRILLLSAYDAGSHKRWREQLVASQPEYRWDTLALAPRFFRWRIRGNALTWLNEPALLKPCDLIIATSMVDLASIRGFHPHLAQTPCLVYMHENQFAYPGSGRQHSSVDPQMVNLTSAIAADRVLFNSAWNRESFLEGSGRFLDRMPDGVPDGLVTRLRNKSRVLPVPISDALFDARRRSLDNSCPHLLWNHRWEYDKGPDRLLLLLDALVDMGQDFRLSLVGEQFRKSPAVFDEIQQRHRAQIVDWGFLPDRSAYDRLLGEADVVVSTALHDFQGLSVLEAMAAGCVALTPDRLAYPEYVPESQRYASFEEDPDAEARAAAKTLVALLAGSVENRQPDGWRMSQLQTQYYDEMQTLLNRDLTTYTGGERYR